MLRAAEDDGQWPRLRSNETGMMRRHTLAGWSDSVYFCRANADLYYTLLHLISATPRSNLYRAAAPIDNGIINGFEKTGRRLSREFCAVRERGNC